MDQREVEWLLSYLFTVEWKQYENILIILVERK